MKTYFQSSNTLISNLTKETKQIPLKVNCFSRHKIALSLFHPYPDMCNATCYCDTGRQATVT